MSVGWIARLIHKLEQLTLGGAPINTEDGTPASGDNLVYDGDSWEFEQTWAKVKPYGGLSGGALKPLGDKGSSDPTEVAIIIGDESAPDIEITPAGDITATGDIEVDGDLWAGSMRGITFSSNVNVDYAWAADAIMYFELGPPKRLKLGYQSLIAGGVCGLHTHNVSTINDFDEEVLGVEVPRFASNLSANISTNGTSWVDFTWNGDIMNGFSLTTGSPEEIVFEEDGDYVVCVDAVTNFNASSTGSYIVLMVDTGSGFVYIGNSERRERTSTTTFTQQTIAGFMYSFSAGDKMKVRGKFGAADAGSVWSAGLTHVSIVRVGPKSS